MKPKVVTGFILGLVESMTGLTLDDFIESELFFEDDENAKTEYLIGLSEKRKDEVKNEER